MLVKGPKTDVVLSYVNVKLSKISVYLKGYREEYC